MEHVFAWKPGSRFTGSGIVPPLVPTWMYALAAFIIVAGLLSSSVLARVSAVLTVIAIVVWMIRTARRTHATPEHAAARDEKAWILEQSMGPQAYNGLEAALTGMRWYSDTLTPRKDSEGGNTGENDVKRDFPPCFVVLGDDAGTKFTIRFSYDAPGYHVSPGELEGGLGHFATLLGCGGWTAWTTATGSDIDVTISKFGRGTDLYNRERAE